MKRIQFLFILTLFVTCNQPGAKEDKVSPVTEASAIPEKRQSVPIIKNPDAGTPFGQLDYDRVVAYDYEGDAKGDGREIIVEDGKLAPKISKKMELSQEQVNSLTGFLGANETYGGGTASCFDPHMGLVFYEGEKVVMHVSICMECNRLSASIPIPATQYHLRNADTTDAFALEGFSKAGQEKLSQLCGELGFSHCKGNPEVAGQ